MNKILGSCVICAQSDSRDVLKVAKPLTRTPRNERKARIFNFLFACFVLFEQFALTKS